MTFLIFCNVLVSANSIHYHGCPHIMVSTILVVLLLYLPLVWYLSHNIYYLCCSIYTILLIVIYVISTIIVEPLIFYIYTVYIYIPSPNLYMLSQQCVTFMVALYPGLNKFVWALGGYYSPASCANFQS